jgi:ubiquinone biosynthesis protein
MKLGWTPIRQLRYLRRYRYILRVLFKYGFAQILSQLKLYGYWERLFIKKGSGKDLPDRAEARLRMALESLGATFIKIGQILSTRVDLLPESYTVELARLQDRVAPFPSARVKQMVEEELNKPLEEVFSRFDLEPLAAASIGQVHRATLLNGTEVVLKVKRPGIDRQVRGDLDILEELAGIIENNSSLGRTYQLTKLADELRQVIVKELDYHSEARNAQRFRKNHWGNPAIYIPRVFWEYTTGNVLTMEYREGTSLSHYLEDGRKSEADLRRIAETLAEAFFQQVFIDGFFHADLHPGNVAVLPDGKLFIMDFGQAGFLSEEIRDRFISILRAFQSFDTASMVDELLSFAFVPHSINRGDLIRDLGYIQEQYYNLPLKEIDLPELFNTLMRVSYKHRLRFPHEFLLMGKALLTVEGTVAQLDPDFNIAAIAAKHGTSLQRKQIRFKVRRLKSTLRSYRRLMEEIPERTVEILRETAAGDLKFKIEISQGETVFKTLENMINRLAFSIVLAALIIGLSQGLWQGNLPWLERLGIPVAELSLIGAALAGLWWLFAIIRSGRI